jgi:RNA polymerase sigma-70 factor, ECF subfamily
LAQEVFLSAYRSLATYKGDAPLGMWLIGIARHRALAFLRDETRHRAHESGRLRAVLAGWRAERMEQRSDPVVDEHERNALVECLKALPEHSASLLTQFYFQARGAAEIARESGRKESGIRMALLRIRQGLRKCIQQRTSAKAVQP